ncbi:hypothetical protein DER44DRAFT_740754 [Fusarium oxysporum]|nr:hypothetical protein DER44DRAFT_740754 [Fusarium oxysporum]
MKLPPTFVAIVAVSCSQVFAQACVPTAERDIAPGYKVRVECDQYRKGTSTPKVPSLDDCAILCKNSGITGAVCSYSQTSKICVVAKPGAPLVSKAGIFLMTPIDDDDDKCPAELKTCEDSYAKCQADLNQAMQELNLKDQELTNEKDTVKKLQKELDEAKKCCLNNGPGGSQPPSNQNPSGGNTEKPTHCGSSLSASAGLVSSGGNLQQYTWIWIWKGWRDRINNADSPLNPHSDIDRFVFIYCQYTSKDEKGILKRFLLISLNQFERPVSSIPVLKQFKSPFDSLYILWTDSDIKQSDLVALNLSLVTEMATDSTMNGKDEEVFKAGHVQLHPLTRRVRVGNRLSPARSCRRIDQARRLLHGRGDGGVQAIYLPSSWRIRDHQEGEWREIKTAFVILALGGPLLNINGIEISDVVARFGYNSDIRFSDPPSVCRFPLIAMGQPPAPLDPLQTFTELANTTWITAVADSFWVGAGVRGSAFNMLDAKIATVFKIQNGALSHIGVFADCRAKMPQSGATKLFASVELGITAVFDLVNGSMRVSGSLSPTSYVIDSSCHLTGGFAAGTWFDPSPYAGDWVFALGGYHHKYTPPAYYPREIPQIGISWQVSDRIFVKAGAYFAITPKACTRGARCSRRVMSGPDRLTHELGPFPLCLGGFDRHQCLVERPYTFCLVYGMFAINVPIKNATVTFGGSNGQDTPGKVSLDTFRGMLQQNGQGAKEELKISCGSGLSSMDDTTGDWTARAGSFAFDVRSNMATTQPYLNGTAVGAANNVYAKPMQLTESSNGLKADLIITVTGASSDDQYRPDSSYNSTKDPSASNSDKSALLDGSTSTILSIYGSSVRTPRPHLSKDGMKPFKISNVIFPIALEDGATSAPVPPWPVEDGSWEGKEATGETIAQKRKNVQGIWKDANTRCEGFAKAWVEAMGWTEFMAATETPNRLIDEFDTLVRGTPLISCGSIDG